MELTGKIIAVLAAQSGVSARTGTHGCLRSMSSKFLVSIHASVFSVCSEKTESSSLLFSRARI